MTRSTSYAGEGAKTAPLLAALLAALVLAGSTLLLGASPWPLRWTAAGIKPRRPRPSWARRAGVCSRFRASPKRTSRWTAPTESPSRRTGPSPSSTARWSTEPKRRLLFKWRVDRAVPPTDLSRASGDDRSLAVHLVFPLDQAKLSFWDRMEHELTRLIAPPMAGRVLTYVWGGSHPEGTVVANPYMSDMRGKIIVLRSRDDAVGRWFREDIDFVADFEKVFGYRPPAPAFLAISADSDDTGSRTVGAVAEIAFEG